MTDDVVTLQFNDDVCFECRLRGTLILCDNCPRSFHYGHCTPSLTKYNLPEGEYVCYYCKLEKNKDAADGKDEVERRVLMGIEKEAEVSYNCC